MRHVAPTACSASTCPTGTRPRCRRSATASGAGELGNVFAADLTFHNAYGPQSGWFWDPALSGGGCLIDLGVHLVDLALWMFDFPWQVSEARATLLRDGRPALPSEAEDYALAELVLANGVHVRIAGPGNLDAGQDAVIEAAFHGTDGGARMRNENGSFFDSWAELLKGRNAERIASPPDNWSGRAAVEWVRKLAAGERFAASTDGLLGDRARARPALRPGLTTSRLRVPRRPRSARSPR